MVVKYFLALEGSAHIVKNILLTDKTARAGENSVKRLINERIFQVLSYYEKSIHLKLEVKNLVKKKTKGLK